jgi:hypothetical protein
LRFKLLFFLFIMSLLVTTLVFLPEAAVKPRPADGGGAAASPWTPLDAFWLSLQTNLPMTHLAATDKWSGPSDRPIQMFGLSLGLRYDDFASIISLFGYVTVPLFLAGVANTWLRQKASGGE